MTQSRNDDALVEAMAEAIGRAETMDEQDFIDCWVHAHIRFRWCAQAKAALAVALSELYDKADNIWASDEAWDKGWMPHEARQFLKSVANKHNITLDTQEKKG